MLPINQPLGIDQCNCFAMRKAARRITRFYDAHLEPSRLRITQFLTLAALNELGSAAVGALAEQLDIERTAMGPRRSAVIKMGWGGAIPAASTTVVGPRHFGRRWRQPSSARPTRPAAYRA